MYAATGINVVTRIAIITVGAIHAMLLWFEMSMPSVNKQTHDADFIHTVLSLRHNYQPLYRQID